MRLLRILTLALFTAATAAITLVYGPPSEPGTTAWFGLHVIDTSSEGAIIGLRDDEIQRIAISKTFIADDLRGRSIFAAAQTKASATAIAIF